jgi:hypothetical protein
MAARKRLSQAEMTARLHGDSPAADIAAEVENTVKQALDPAKATSEKPAKPKLPKRRRTTVYIRDDYYRQAETATRYLKDRGLAPKSISAFIDDAIGRELTRLAKAHNDGEPWPKAGDQ